MLQKKLILFYSKSIYLSDRSISCRAKKGDYIREIVCPVAVVFLELRARGQAKIPLSIMQLAPLKVLKIDG